MAEEDPPPQLPSSSDEPITLLNAVRTAFAKDADPEMFLARASDQIREMEHAIIETCAKNRIRTDDNLYALLESRDAIAEQSAELDKSKQLAADITTSVNDAVRELQEKVRIRKNLDATLVIAAQTRKIVRMYARTEDTIDAQRLYTALRMLRMLEDEMKAIQKGTVIEELIPDTKRLRSKIVVQARKALHGWLSVIRTFEHPLGEYAVYHAAAQAVAHRSFLESCRVSTAIDRHIMPFLPAPTGLGAFGKPWTPLLTPKPTASVPVSKRSSRAGSLRAVSMISVPSLSSVQSGGTIPSESGMDTRRNSKPLIKEFRGEVPKLFLRPLLQSIQVNEGMDLVTDMQSEYRRERLTQLHNIFENAQSYNEDPFAIETDTFPFIEKLKSAVVEEVVCRVCGFFVVERAVETYSKAPLVSRAVVDGEWWPWAYARLNDLLSKLDKASTDVAPEKSRVQSVRENVLRFARTNGLCGRTADSGSAVGQQF
ncbi:hypothetical protein BWQ96_02120 [Gracilariopsis chorda]|uniref:Exocyst complex component EXOC6/Sec15 N-terminal domain-containing protein n=1 Tax=Gracilariopsis chorda TaxID=448386 RepID=A0A2V3J1B4_9FLOR|nr:hypothetical protein BWQ96_02120 [Gracilariopsis chorda]|eukprot:PXF48168.1 hypothetical protein BWQ96_02120 [Gracilariopsis chorda]